MDVGKECKKQQGFFKNAVFCIDQIAHALDCCSDLMFVIQWLVIRSRDTDAVFSDVSDNVEVFHQDAVDVLNLAHLYRNKIVRMV